MSISSRGVIGRLLFCNMCCRNRADCQYLEYMHCGKSCWDMTYAICLVYALWVLRGDTRSLSKQNKHVRVHTHTCGHVLDFNV